MTVKKLLCFFAVMLAVNSMQAQSFYDPAKDFNPKSIPADVRKYTLLVYSPLATDKNPYIFNDVLRNYKGRYEIGDLQSFSEGKYKDINNYKYALIINRKGLEPGATYSIYITEVANRSHIQSANLISKDWEKILRFYVNKLNGF